MCWRGGPPAGTPRRPFRTCSRADLCACQNHKTTQATLSTTAATSRSTSPQVLKSYSTRQCTSWHAEHKLICRSMHIVSCFLALGRQACFAVDRVVTSARQHPLQAMQPRLGKAGHANPTRNHKAGIVLQTLRLLCSRQATAWCVASCNHLGTHPVNTIDRVLPSSTPLHCGLAPRSTTRQHY